MKLSLKLLKNRKRFVCCIVGIITFSTVINIFSSILTQSILQYKWEKGTSLYGKFACGLSDISNEEKELALQEFSSENVGVFSTYQDTQINNLMLTLGYVDISFSKQVTIELKSGRFPENEDEVIVEEFVLNLLENPNYLEVVYNNKKIKLKIVGIIKNYSSKLSVPSENNIGNVYPNIICNKKNCFERSETNRSMLISLNDTVDIKKDYITNTQNIYNIIKKSKLPTNKLYFNDNLLNKGMIGCREVWRYSIFFSLCVTLIITICIYAILDIFYKDYRKKLAILNILGKEEKRLLDIIKQQLVLFFVIGNFFGIIIGSILIKILKTKLHLYMDNISKLMIFNFFFWELMLVCALLTVLLKKKMQFWNNSLPDNLLNIKRKTDNNCNKGKKGKKNIIENMKSVNVICAISFTAVFIVTYFSLYIHEITIQDNYNIPDYQLFSKEVVETEVVNGFIIEDNPDKFILESDIQRLKRYHPYIEYDLWPNFNGYTILFEQDKIPRYFKEWNEMYKNVDTSYEQSIIQENWPEQFDNLIPVNNVDFIVADDNLLKDIIKKYDISILPTELKNKSEILLFLPYDTKDLGNIKTQKTLKIGGISQYDEKVTGEQFIFNIAEIIYQPYSLKNGYISQERDNIIVVLSENTAKKSGLFKGYRGVSIQLKKGISQNIIREIDDLINEMSNKIQGSILYSKEELLLEEKLFTTYNKIISMILIGINIIFGSIIVIILVLRIVRKHRRIYGILQAIGLSYEENVLCVWESLIKSVMLSYIFDVVIVMVIFSNFESFKYFFSNFCITIFQTLFLLFLICLIVYNWLKNRNIKDLMKND